MNVSLIDITIENSNLLVSIVPVPKNMNPGRINDINPITIFTRFLS